MWKELSHQLRFSMKMREGKWEYLLLIISSAKILRVGSAFSASQDEKPLFLKAPSSAALHTTFPNCFSSFLQSSNLFSEVIQGGKVILTYSISLHNIHAENIIIILYPKNA